MPTRRSVLAASAAVLAPLAARAQGEVTKERDVLLGTVDGEEVLADVHRPPARDAPRPAVVLFHGGGLGAGNRSDMDWAAGELAAAGYVAVNVSYRLIHAAEGRNRWPAQLEDARRAVRWIRANAAAYGVDPERVGSYGHSSGGHLAALLGTTEGDPDPDPALAPHSGRVAAVVSLAGEMDLTVPSLNPGDDVGLVNLLGGTRDEVPEAYRDASPIAHVDAETAPFLIIQGGRDEWVSLEHGVRMARALHEAGIDHTYAEIADASHFDFVSWTIPGPLTLWFLGRHLRPER